MLPGLSRAVSLSLTIACAVACGACGASRPASGSPTPAPVLEPVLPPVAESRPAEVPASRAEPPASGAAPREPPRSALGAGSPFYGTYEVTRIVKASGGAESPSALSSCDVSDCVFVRRSYAFEGTTLRMRYLLVSIAVKDGAASTTVVCDAQAQIDVTWEEEAMIVPVTVVAKASADVFRRTQRPSGPNKFKVDWNKDHLGCSSTLRAGRYAVKDVSRDKNGARPARLTLASPEQQHQLQAVDEEVDIEGAINSFFGQR